MYRMFAKCTMIPNEKHRENKFYFLLAGVAYGRSKCFSVCSYRRHEEHRYVGTYHVKNGKRSNENHRQYYTCHFKVTGINIVY